MVTALVSSGQLVIFLRSLSVRNRVSGSVESVVPSVSPQLHLSPRVAYTIWLHLRQQQQLQQQQPPESRERLGLLLSWPPALAPITHSLIHTARQRGGEPAGHVALINKCRAGTRRRSSGSSQAGHRHAINGEKMKRQHQTKSMDQQLSAGTMPHHHICCCTCWPDTGPAAARPAGQ